MPAGHQSEAEPPFPKSPIAATDKLVPIASWADMHREVEEMGVEFDYFWYESVMEGVAYFFRWLPEPRCTVLVVWVADEPSHIEARRHGDILITGEEATPILGEVLHAFRAAGLWRDEVSR